MVPPKYPIAGRHVKGGNEARLRRVLYSLLSRAARSPTPLRAAILLTTVSLFGSGLLELRYTPNDDAAFSLLRNFGVARTRHIGFGLVLAGALGNVVDRLVRGYVVDFIHVTRWPVFKVADIAVVAGVLLLALAALRTREPTPI